MLEFSDDVVSAELVVQPRVIESNTDIINAQVVANQKEPAVCHASEAGHTHHVSTVFQVALIKILLAVVEDFVFGAQSVIRDLFITHTALNFCVLHFTAQLQAIHLVQSVARRRNKADSALIGSAIIPVALRNFYLEIFNF